MKYSKRLLALVLLGISLPSLANVDNAFEKIKSDPNALYAFLKEMPKGGELHYHLAGGAYPETMLAIAAKDNYCLNELSRVISKVNKQCDGIKAASLSANSPLYQKTLRAWSMKNFIAGEESGHDHFFSTFYRFLAIVLDKPVPLLAEVMQRAASQHEHYMELMILPEKGISPFKAKLPVNSQNYALLKQQLLADKQFASDIDAVVAEVDSLLPSARQSLACDKYPSQAVCQLTVKFQYYSLREQPLDTLFPQALRAFAAASRSKAIVGVNLVQAEDGFISLRDYREQMELFAFLHQAYPDVHIALHAGELAQDSVLPENLRFHIHDAIKVAHAERIGHGVDIAFENNADKLVSYMAKNYIPVEINLISNQKILNISGLSHPLNYYLSHKVPVVLSTDDEGVLRTDLTSQYVEAAIGHGLNYQTLKQINRNALTYSFLPGKSLWSNSEKETIVPNCSDLNSSECIKFTNENEKARVQKDLELDLIRFEKLFLN